MQMNRLRSVWRAIAVALTVSAAAPALSATGPAERPTFAIDTHPPAPDYADRRAWAVLPDASGLSALVPPNATPKATRESAVDVFYVHPTTYGAPNHWNQDIADAATNAWTDDSVIARQSSIFNVCCRIFAPRYRQAATGAVTSTDGGGDRAYDLAYQDVRRAFRHYIDHDNHGRPFILAGHSQGTLLIYRLIEDEIDKTPLAKRMVAAYAVGRRAVARRVRSYLRHDQTVRDAEPDRLHRQLEHFHPGWGRGRLPSALGGAVRQALSWSAGP